MLSGSRTGAPQPSCVRLTRQRFEPLPGCGLPLIAPSIGGLPGDAGRFEAKIKYVPSGAIAGSMSSQLPENGAITGSDHFAFTRCETRMKSEALLPRPK